MEGYVLGFVGCNAVQITLCILLSRDACLRHVPFLKFNPIRNATAKAVRTFSQGGYLLGCWMQPQPFKVHGKSPPKRFQSIPIRALRSKVHTDHPRDEAHSISPLTGDPLPTKHLCLHPSPSPQPLPPASSEPNALKSLEGRALLTRNNRNQLSLQRFSVLKGLGALESFSHSSTAVRHWATNSTGMVSSKL